MAGTSGNPAQEQSGLRPVSTALLCYTWPVSLLNLRYRILKKRSLVICALAAMVTAGVLAGCGTTYYFAGRVLPPSGIANRVLIAIQNPNVASRGLLQFVDAYYDIRQSYNDKIPAFSISGYSGALPSTIQNLPEEQL